MSEHLTPEEKAEWRKDAEAYQWWAVESGRILALLDALDDAERERDDAREALTHRERMENINAAEVVRLREALARVEALASKWESDRLARVIDKEAAAYLIRDALAGIDPTDTEGDDRD